MKTEKNDTSLGFCASAETRIGQCPIPCHASLTYEESVKDYKVVGIVLQDDGLCQQNNYPMLFNYPHDHKKRSNLIQEVIEKLRKSFYSPKKELTSLQRLTGRQLRSERRESAILLLQHMIYYVDDATGKVGRMTGNHFRNYSVYELAEKTGLKVKRVIRALKTIAQAGYMKVTRQFKRLDNGDVIALPSIREFTPRFFVELGIKVYGKWVALQEWKKERNAERDRKDGRREGGLMSKFITQTLKLCKSKKGATMREEKLDDKEAERNRRLIDRALYLYKKDPSKSVGEYHRELLAATPS